MKFTSAEERAILERSGIVNVVGESVLGKIRAMYDGPDRYYHRWDHALSVISWVNHVFDTYAWPMTANDRPVQIQMAIAALFHDAVYVVGAVDNEANSAALFRDVMVDRDQAMLDGTFVDALILSTALHGKMERTPGMNELVAIFMDCDIASFAEPRWEVALETDNDVTRELETKFKREEIVEMRKKFLSGLLAKRSIFLSLYFQQHFEASARNNIRRLLDAQIEPRS